MTTVYKIAKLVGIAKTRGWRKKAGHLIAPRPVERVLGDGQQFQVGVTHLDDIRQQRIGQFAVAEIAEAFLDLALP